MSNQEAERSNVGKARELCTTKDSLGNVCILPGWVVKRVEAALDAKDAETLAERQKREGVEKRLAEVITDAGGYAQKIQHLEAEVKLLEDSEEELSKKCAEFEKQVHLAYDAGKQELEAELAKSRKCDWCGGTDLVCGKGHIESTDELKKQLAEALKQNEQLRNK